MGQMISGIWSYGATVDSSVASDGTWSREPSVVRDHIGPGGAYPAEAGRYHLYAAWNCPWAHRVLLMCTLLGLEEAVPVSFVTPKRTADGWVFSPTEGYRDALLGAHALHEVYTRGAPDYSGHVTVPLLYDSRTDRLVSNESADLVRMMNDGFAAFARAPHDFYPLSLREQIDQWNVRIHAGLNNGVYRAGFAESQHAYEVAVDDVFETLAAIEAQLHDQEWLLGDQLTEADVRLFPTLARFDVAYHSAFRCTRRRLLDYPRLWDYARRFYALPGVADTVKFDIYRRGYHSQSSKRNPLGIIPVAPAISWESQAFS